MSRTGRGTRPRAPNVVAGWRRFAPTTVMAGNVGRRWAYGPDDGSPIAPLTRRRDAPSHSGRRARIDLRRLEPGAPAHRQGRVTRVGRLRERALAAPEHGSTPGLDAPSVTARPAQAGRRYTGRAGRPSARGAHQARRVAERVGF